MEIPRGVVRFNRAINNPIQRQYAWLLPPWVIVVHRGRRSGRVYRTPVVGFRRGRTLAIAILYGERSDWVLNVLAGGASVVRGGRTYPLVSARIVGPEEPGLSAPARRFGRASGKLLIAELGPAAAGFGRGPRAGEGARLSRTA
jgi:deazaflavin-dependent oxidoreductase (nitroreductase family)